jgi:hypothetical protein
VFLFLFFVVLPTSSFVNPGVSCTASDPQVCGPSGAGTWVLALAVATPILLISAPALGCLSAAVLAVLGAGFDPDHGFRIWWAVGGILSVALLAHLTLIRFRQHRVASARVDQLGARGSVDSANVTPNRIRMVLIGAAILTGIVLTQIYEQRVAAKQDHERHAVRVDAVVEALHGSSSTVDVLVPGIVEPVRIEVVSSSSYGVGQTVPVLADVTAVPPWVRLVAERKIRVPGSVSPSWCCCWPERR